MKKGFTMIELIFVIVILGILAAVAIPRLAATRDDANVAKETTNLATCIQDLATMYTSEGNITDVNDSAACQQLVCFSITKNFDDNITVNNVDGDVYCGAAQELASEKDLNKTYVFGGQKVKW